MDSIQNEIQRSKMETETQAKIQTVKYNSINFNFDCAIQ